MKERSTGFRGVEPGLVESSRLGGADPFDDPHAGGFECPRSARPVRVANRVDHAGHASLEKRSGAGRRASLVIARLECYHRDAPAYIVARSPGRSDRLDLGVGLADAPVVSLAQHASLGVDHHTTHHRVGAGGRASPLGEVQSVRHQWPEARRLLDHDVPIRKPRKANHPL